ncbi:hypothetical protein GCM10007415_22910 [Parapedobacter pyrenivorans]|uniref:Trypsin-like peptidase domain-containing protein n=1 Tax=Parapedobacter pyrenivorans TaxID=1305674 RepID=A0A917HSZ6_9SPHI|nr:hypothetical protein [Parapedobacter pyrenivorans]GGG88313.1 hypothetical protein GCM10007415_22910 [Parapedobacter pyrenivorans]
MNEKLTNKPCVRIKIFIDQQLRNHGSGCLVKGTNGFFVLTAYHCIYGENNIFKDVRLDQILIERQDFYNTPFETIEAVEIVASDECEDWALLKVNYLDSDNEFPEILISDSFKIDMPVTFTGFQVVNPEQCRTFKSRVLNGISNNEFRITLSGQDKFKGGSDDACGLSGSGAFIINEDIFYLIGILKSVTGSEALNNDIKCCSLGRIVDHIGLEKFDISTEIFGDNWGSEQFGELTLSDARNLVEKFEAVDSKMSTLKIQRYCQELSLGKSELSSLLERDLSAIKYRIFDACQGELVDFIDQSNDEQLTTDQVKALIQRFKNKAIEIIQVKSKKYEYPILDDDLIYRIVLDLINECYLSFDKEGIYAE